MSLRLLTLALLLPMTVQAAEIQKEGTDSFTSTWVLTMPNTIKLGDRSFTTFEVDGVSTGGAMFDNFGFRCVGQVESIGSARTGYGVCSYTDKDGDQILQTYDQKESAGGVTLVGGSGKFAGISGTGEWSVLSYPSSDDKRVRAVVAHKVHWKIQ